MVYRKPLRPDARKDIWESQEPALVTFLLRISSSIFLIRVLLSDFAFSSYVLP